MKFGKLTPDADIDNIIECDLEDDILFHKMPDEIVYKKAVKVKEGQYAILYEEGKVYDAINKKGMYQIDLENSSKVRREMEKWKNFEPPKPDNSKLCVIFFNMKEIKNNNFNISNPVEYIDWTKPRPLKAKFTCNGKFNFKISEPALFFSRVYGVREHYSKFELIEQIRKNAINSIEEGINELSNEYKLSIELIKNKTSELEIKVKRNKYDLKLETRGIIITYFELSDLDIEADKEYIKEENNVILKRLDNVLDKIKYDKKIIDKNTVKLTLTDNGELIYKSNIGICSRCGNLLDQDSKYCIICGAKI